MRSNSIKALFEQPFAANAAVTLFFFALYLPGPYGSPVGDSLFSLAGIICFVGWANRLGVRTAAKGTADSCMRVAAECDNIGEIRPNATAQDIINLVKDRTLPGLTVLQSGNSSKPIKQLGLEYTSKSTRPDNLIAKDWLSTRIALIFIIVGGIAQIVAAATHIDKKNSVTQSWVLSGSISFAFAFLLASLRSAYTIHSLGQKKSEADALAGALTTAIVELMKVELELAKKTKPLTAAAGTGVALSATSTKASPAASATKLSPSATTSPAPRAPTLFPSPKPTTGSGTPPSSPPTFVLGEGGVVNIGQITVHIGGPGPGASTSPAAGKGL